MHQSHGPRRQSQHHPGSLLQNQNPPKEHKRTAQRQTTHPKQLVRVGVATCDVADHLELAARKPWQISRCCQDDRQ
eukprot:2963473-Amphidinium_carterae.1